MPSGFLQKTASIAGSGSAISILRFPANGRKSGRIDSILCILNATGTIGSVSPWVRDSRLDIYIDDPNPSLATLPLAFKNAYFFSADMGNVKMTGDLGVNYWAMALFDVGIFAYYFDLRIFNADTGGGGTNHDFHVSVSFEEFEL